jgi:hypothetical protein
MVSISKDTLVCTKLQYYYILMGLALRLSVLVANAIVRSSQKQMFCAQ